MRTAIFEPRSYSLSEDLADNSLRLGSSFEAPEDSEREEMAFQKLGIKGWGRLLHFRNYYSTEWGEQNSKPLSPRSLELFYRFLERFDRPFQNKPSVFLTDDGFLELCWKDASGNAVQVEFQSKSIEYYLETNNEEGEISSGRVEELANRLNQI